MGNISSEFCTKCAFCPTKTNICQYSLKYKKTICNDCLYYMQACCHCNEWYSKGLIRYNDNLFCINCLNNLHEFYTKKPDNKCTTCKKLYTTNILSYEDKIYCIDCTTKLTKLYHYNKKIE